MDTQATTPAPGRAPGAGPRVCSCALVLACLLLAPLPALAHGVETRQGPASASVVAICEYSDGEPMGFAKVTVRNPQGGTHQVGNADAQGRFAWLAEENGQWKAVFEDGQGHRGEISLSVAGGEAKQAAAQASAPSSQPLFARVAWGLSFIFWLSGLAMWWKARKQASSRAS